MKVFQLIYRSQARFYFTDDHLVALLHKARGYNTPNKITGLLLYGFNQFIQVLEGEEAAVRALFHKIEADPRHENITLLFTGFTNKRGYADWAMAFRPLDAEKLKEIEGYMDPVQTDDSSGSRKDLLAPLKLLQLMQQFAETGIDPF